MQFKTSHVFLALVIFGIVSQGENVRDFTNSQSQERQGRNEFHQRIRDNRNQARELEKLSKVALDRYKQNCVFVIDLTTKQETYLQPGQQVIDTKLNRELRPGQPICNRLGDTAIVSQAGTIVDIARVNVADLPEFRQLLEQRR
ncbi:MAG: hypothetical protein F6K21_03280 [Symploca sp. SIO2D2]|nr:hypothetical protein [Symploca sp. SIO2D2]